MKMEDDTFAQTSHNMMALPADFNMKEFLKKDVDLLAFFPAKEVEEMCDAAKLRYKNMALNYEMMIHMGLPAIKPSFMRSPALKAKEKKKLEEKPEDPSSSSDSDTDEEWTPYGSQRKKNQQGLKRKTFATPVWKPTPEKKVRKNTQKRIKKTENKTDKPEDTSRTYQLRERSEVNFMNLEPPDEDHFLYCEECNKEYDMDCPVHGPLDYVMDKEVDITNDPDRALHTLPDNLEVKESSIVGAGLGVFTVKEIPPRTKFGPYGGVKVTDQSKAHKSGYCWQVYENGRPSHFVDAQEKATSNWMRYVNCALSETDQNLVAFQHKGAIYYRSFKPILPGQELLVWYGDDYARELGLVRDKNMLFRPSYVDGEVFYPCVFCKTAFTAAYYCVRHLMVVHGRDKLKAEDIQVLDAWLRQNKQYKYGRDKENEPSNKANKNYLNDKEHVLLENAGGNSSEKPFKCDVCRYACSQKRDLIKHKNTHTGEKPYKCDICKYACSLKHHLIQHKRIHTGEKPYKCDICKYACSNNSDLFKHKRIHTGEKPYKCDICKYACSQNSALIHHKRIHTGEKPYKCDICKYAFSLKHHLIQHKRIHTGEKPYKCDICKYACSNNSYLFKHKRIHTGEKPYKCDICKYACSRNSALIQHKKIHTGEKPYKCDICKYACSRKSDLIRHKRIHTGEKPYKCDICKYACSQKSTLIQHKKIHTGEKPYKCVVLKHFM